MLLRLLLVLVAVCGLTLGGCSKEEPQEPAGGMDQMKQDAENMVDDTEDVAEDMADEAEDMADEAEDMADEVVE